MKKMKIKCCIAAIFVFIAFVGITRNIILYVGGYDEVLAMVTKVYHNGKMHNNEAYNLSWVDKDGNQVTVGNQSNIKGYKAGDMVVIKVDKRTHQSMYKSLMVSTIIWIIILAVSIIFLLKYAKLIGQKLINENKDSLGGSR